MAKRNRYPKSTASISQKKPVDVLKEYRAFTSRANGLANRIVTPVRLAPAYDPKQFQGKEPPYPLILKTALWDTGATNSVLTSATVKEMNLTPTGTTMVNHAGGTTQSNTYLVNFILPNNVGIVGIRVSECENIVGAFDAIVGMDIINQGDLAITNVNGMTMMSFRIPSIEAIDYVTEHHLRTKDN